MRKGLSLGVMLAALIVSGCDDGPSVPTALQTSNASSRRSEADVKAQNVARAMALGLSTSAVRVALRDAMRESPMTEHKLVLREYASTDRGKLLILEAARASGTTAEAMTQAVAALPEMDLYVPFRAHRRGWQATEDIIVAATMDVDDPTIAGYSIDGRRVLLDARAGMPTRTVILLQPAETKRERSARQADVPGAVIQESDDGEYSGGFEHRLADGQVMVGGLSMAAAPSSDGIVASHDAAGLASPGPNSVLSMHSPSTQHAYVERFIVYITDWWGDSEIEWRSDYYDTRGQYLASGVYRHEGVNYATWYYPSSPDIHWRLNDYYPHLYCGDFLLVQLYETDLAGSDGFFGDTTVTFYERGDTLEFVDNPDNQGFFITGKMVPGFAAPPRAPTC